MAYANPTSVVKELVLTRVLDAPRALVWQMWTDPKHLAQWWGPKGFTNPVCEVDLRPGGALVIHMRAPDGTLYPSRGVFHEIVEPERLVFTTTAFEDEQGIPQLEGLNTVTFSEENGKTKIVLKAVILKATPEMAGPLAGMEQGWSESLDKLAEHAAGQAQPEPPQPSAALKRLGERLAGKWRISGGAEGRVTYEWLPGDFFLLQTFDLFHDGHAVKGIEVIGHEQKFGQAPSAEIKSRAYDNRGNTLDYVYELEGDTLTIWGGEKGSPAYFRGTFSADGNQYHGGWVWPGGGYAANATRIS